MHGASQGKVGNLVKRLDEPWAAADFSCRPQNACIVVSPVSGPFASLAHAGGACNMSVTETGQGESRREAAKSMTTLRSTAACERGAREEYLAACGGRDRRDMESAQCLPRWCCPRAPESRQRPHRPRLWREEWVPSPQRISAGAFGGTRAAPEAAVGVRPTRPGACGALACRSLLPPSPGRTTAQSVGNRLGISSPDPPSLLTIFLLLILCFSRRASSFPLPSSCSCTSSRLTSDTTPAQSRCSASTFHLLSASFIPPSQWLQVSSSWVAAVSLPLLLFWLRFCTGSFTSRTRRHGTSHRVFSLFVRARAQSLLRCKTWLQLRL